MQAPNHSHTFINQISYAYPDLLLRDPNSDHRPELSNDVHGCIEGGEVVSENECCGDTSLGGACRIGKGVDEFVQDGMAREGQGVN